MGRMLQISIVIAAIFLSLTHVGGQHSSKVYQDPLKAKVNMDDFHDPYAFSIKYLEAPHPSGKAAMRAFLRQRKLDAQKITPVNPDAVIRSRGSIPAPEVLASFSGNNIITGTPLDNHLAVNAAENVVSTINTHMLVTNTVGFWMGSYKLESFFQSVGSTDRFFDPRIIYDPETDRFILVLINGSGCNDSQIVLAFSTSNNPRGTWNLYALDGCLKDDGTFADYPMISLTETDFFLTYNAVHSDSTWQTGFYGTQIHQINKQDGYDGLALSRRVWTDVSFNGRLLRNICPVRNADEDLPSTMHFLSTRNFDISNDTIFLLHLTGTQSDSNATLDIEYRLLDNPYGVPPYAVQPRDSLDTNDARVLDAFAIDGQIQWVGNTMDFNSGRSGVFHGMLQIEDQFQTATGNIIVHPTDYLGYPGIAWTGSQPTEKDALIVMSHSSITRYPGGSVVYADGLGNYSDFVTVVEGLKPVDMLTSPIERWGDYAGIQRLYHQPGSVWASYSYGKGNNVNEAWIAKIARQEETVRTNDPSSNVHLKTYPNPANDYVQIEIDNPDAYSLQVELFNNLGQHVETLYVGEAHYPGKASINFSTHKLAPGGYLVQVKINGTDAVVKEFIKAGN